jgi:hypothetical protein
MSCILSLAHLVADRIGAGSRALSNNNRNNNANLQQAGD